MAFRGTETIASEFYPPRARWHTRLFLSLSKPVRRYLHFERLRLRGELKLGDLLLCLALPGFSFFAHGRKLAGWVVLSGYAVSAILFLVALGFLASDVAYGLMISIHATSIVYLQNRWLFDSRFGTRLVAALGTLFAVWALLYAPLVSFAERHWLMPLRLAGRVVIVDCSVKPRSLKRGDWVAYEIPDQLAHDREVGRAILAGGLGLDPIVALPGDSLRFTGGSLFVNNQPFPVAPYMPVSGELKMPEKVWFIWPHFAITMRGGAFDSDVSATLQQTAMVGQNQILGRPFKHWFGRRQWP